MRRIFPLIALVISVVAKKTSDTSTLSKTTTSTKSPKVTPTPVPSGKESKNDHDLPKLIFTIPADDTYYNANVNVGGEDLELRLDITQPEIWVMGDNFYRCDQIASFYSHEIAAYGTDIPKLVSEDPLFLATACAENGVYTTETKNMPSATIPGLTNGQTYTVPNLDSIEAIGKFETDNITFALGNNQELELGNFSFVSVDETNLWTGGLGLAGNPTGSGLLDSLVDRGIIKSASYSLWFSELDESGNGMCEVLLGAVDKNYFEGDFYSFNMIPYAGGRSDDYTDQLARGLRLPTLLLTDIQVKNQNSKDQISLLSDKQSIPVLLESRTMYSYLPIEALINLAIQLDAVYNSDVDEWIVECDKLYDVNALLVFSFGNLDIDLPLSEFISNATYNSQDLTFSNGKQACYLMVLPCSEQGFSSLGLPFLRKAYIALDNEGQRIAIAKAKSLNVEASDYSASQSPSAFPTSHPPNVTGSDISFISSGRIPFATHNNQSLTSLTYNSALTGSPAIPERFSGAVILSGQIITPIAGSSAIASAADELSAKLKSSGRSLRTYQLGRSMSTEVKLLVAIIGITTATLVLI